MRGASTGPGATLLPFEGFRDASRAVLSMLRERLGFRLWLTTRTEGEDWIVLGTEGDGYPVEEGQVLRWSDSFCSRMVRGEGPPVAPDSEAVSAYAGAPIASQLPIRAYIGMPLRRADGALFGTLCAIDPEPADPSIESERPLVELAARLLGTILETELEAQEAQRRLERAEAESATDELTGLTNRRGWERLLDAEEERSERYGSPLGVLVVDLDDLKRINDAEGHRAGDRLLQRTSGVLTDTVRRTDLVARLGGDEFGVLAIETRPDELLRLAERVRSGLAAAGISASVGWAEREPRTSLDSAVDEADRRMYEVKARRKERQLRARGA